MEAKDACFYEESFIDRPLLALEILEGGGHFLHPPSWLNKPKKNHGEQG